LKIRWAILILRCALLRLAHSSRKKQLGFVLTRIAQTLLRVARDEQPIFQGLVHSVAALRNTRAFAQRPGVFLAEG
jgi:hypothetical protein